MKNVMSFLTLPAAVGSILVIPLIVLEYVNTNGFKTYGFPGPLFGFLWLLPFVFTILLLPTVRDVRSGSGIASSPISLGFRAVLMIGIAVVWAGLVNDQMPCFMGVPNCD